jgi:uncharacterized protein (TIGR01777 family)
MRVFVTGGTGLVGRRLIPLLLGRGDQVKVLSRRAAVAKQMLGAAAVVEGDPMQAGGWMEAVEDCDAVVHLAGENVFGRRWSAAVKQMLLDSRVLGTRHVAQAILRKPAGPDGRPKVLVNASAIGYYGMTGDEELDESSPAGDDFLARLCVDWEKETHAVEPAGVRCAVVRVGVVLDREGGALAKMTPPFKMFAGGPIGSGKQWLSWIHHEDLCGILMLGLDNPEARGPLNGTAPGAVTNKEFSKALGRALHRPAIFPTPRFMLRVLLGEVADVICTGQHVLPRRPLALGYNFRYPSVDAALAQIFS